MPTSAVSTQDIIVVVSLVVLIACIMYDYLMPDSLVLPGTPGNPAATPPIPAAPERREHHFGRFAFRWILTIIAVALLMGNTRVGQALFLTVNGGGVPTFSHSLTGTSLPATPASPIVKFDATMPLPAGFVFDPTTGELTAPADIPAGYQLVAKYDSSTVPLQGQEAVNGTILGTGKKWNLPKDATNILVRYYDEPKKAVTQFVNPF